MFSWLGTDDRRKKDPEVFQTVSEGLKKLYKTKLLPLEEHYKFHEFHSPALEDADFDNKPMVLLVGQYSTGKTSFIRWAWWVFGRIKPSYKDAVTPILQINMCMT